MKKQTIFIIGAGSTGLSTALNLARLSNNKIVVVDKSFIGSGQTGQCCGFVRNFYNAKEMAFSAHESMKQIKEMCKTDKNLEYVRKGLLVIDTLKNSKAMEKNVKMLKSLGIKAEYLEGKEINKIHPYLETDSVCAGFDQEAGYINPRLIVDYLARKCIDMGVKIIEQSKAVGLKRKKDGFYIKTNNGEIKADKVFNATAAFNNKINTMLDFELPVRVIKTNNCFYRLPMESQKYLVAMADFVNLFYIIPHKEFIDVSTIALDLKREVDPEDKNICKLDDGITDEYLNLIAKRVENAEKSAVLGGFGSCIDVTDDYYPILSKIDEIPNYYCATGFSGTGFKHFPMAGRLMAEIILERQATYPDLVLFFRYNRFKQAEIRTGVSDSYFAIEE